MIKRVQIKSGYMSTVPSVGNGRIFEFKDGLNVLFGDTGSYKSSLLKVIAAYSAIEKGGYSRISDPEKLASKLPSHFPWVYRQYSPGQCDALVEWDGTPSFYNDAKCLNKNDMTFFFSSEKASTDGLTSDAEQLEILASKPSSGQYRVHKINKIMKAIQNAPDLSKVPDFIVDKVYAQLEVDYINKLPKTGKITLILDEPEDSLSIPKQLNLFNVLKGLAEHFQIIMATHSPFVLFTKNVNVIEMTEGYAKLSKELIKKHVNGK